jgi:DNA-binding HxlR family transcriptional regulator
VAPLAGARSSAAVGGLVVTWHLPVQLSPDSGLTLACDGECVQKPDSLGMLGSMTAVTAVPRTCSIARTLEIVGEKWALLAVREAFLGNRRFDEMVRRTGAPRDTLAARLRRLVDAGILERRPYAEHPARFEYHLTPAGRDLYPVIMSLMAWGDQHLAGPEGPPLVLEHRDHRLNVQLSCAECGEVVHYGDAHPLPRDHQNQDH